MVVRCYIVPQAGTGTLADPWRPAYVREAIGSDNYMSLPYRAATTASFLVAVDVVNGQHTTIAAGNGTLAVPADLAITIANNTVRNTVRSALEGYDIPAHWVATGATYRSVLRGVACIMLLAQRLRRNNGQLLPQGITLDSTIADLTQNQRNTLEAACVSLGWSTEGVPGATTLRAFIRGVSQQHPHIVRVGALQLDP